MIKLNETAPEVLTVLLNAAGIPIHGCSSTEDPQVIDRIDFKDEATEEQMTEAYRIRDEDMYAAISANVFGNAAREMVAANGITVVYEPTGESLTLWARGIDDYQNYRGLASDLKDWQDNDFAPRVYRISTMTGGWDAVVCPLSEGEEGYYNNRLALRKMLLAYTNIAQQYYEQII